MRKQRRRRGGEGSNGGNPRGAPYRERRNAMNFETGTFDDEGMGFQDTFP
jgi:hypothetical protein